MSDQRTSQSASPDPNQPSREELEARWRVLFDEAQDAICILDLDTFVIQQANPALQKILGYRPAKALGQPFLGLVAGGQQTDALALIHQANTEGSMRGALSMRHAAGGTQQVEVTITRLPWNGVSRLMVALRDIGDRTEAQRLLEEARRDRAKAETAQEYVSLMSHQFRTPLASILLSADTLRRYTARLTEVERNQHVQRILVQAIAMRDLLDDVDLILRGVLDPKAFMPRPTHVATHCAALLNSITGGASTQHTIVFENAATVHTLMLDTRLLDVALQNLLSNAIKYTPNGGTIRLRLANTPNELLLSVQDTGMGIPPDALEMIFNLFYRAKNATAIQGTGVGLFLVQDRVRAHGGRVTVHTELNVGTTFTIYLPLQLPQGTDGEDTPSESTP